MSELEDKIIKRCIEFITTSYLSSGKNYESDFYDPETETNIEIWKIAEEKGLVKSVGNRQWVVSDDIKKEIEEIYKKYGKIIFEESIK